MGGFSVAALLEPSFPEDCQVSDWEIGMCSATCGGGVKKLSRKVGMALDWGCEDCQPFQYTHGGIQEPPFWHREFKIFEDVGPTRDSDNFFGA